MDKVIDGVDISGCCCYENGKCLWAKRYYENDIVPDCEKVKNCYYKQLKRKELECSSLIDEIAELREQLDDCYKPCKDCSTTHSLNLEVSENKQLKAEKEELKQENEQLHNDLKECGIKREQYRQALQEIRDIILSPEIIDEETKKLHTSEELDNIVRWHREDKLSKIKAKINEVIGAEE